MRILFVVATDLSANNSAAMCHTAYIRGMRDAGHDVSVLTVLPTAKELHDKVNGVNYIELSDENWLVRKARNNRVKTPAPAENENANTSANRDVSVRVKNFVKYTAITLMGASVTWRRRANRFRDKRPYDAAISLASPADSHLVAAALLKSGRIKAKHSCQIWEDPWASDLYGGHTKTLDKIRKQENAVLDLAEKVIYVTPMTMENQKKLYARNAEKMDWLPLPVYDEDVSDEVADDNQITYGYFGQYYPQVRNLKPFYNAAIKGNKHCIICGDPDNLFESTEKIEINSRVSLEVLKQKDFYTDVLVCVANLGGGQIPGKIYQYSGSRKPILYILDGSEEEKKILRDYFGQFHRYVFCENNEKDILRAMNEIEENYHFYDSVSYFDGKNIAEEIMKIIGFNR